MREAYRLDPTEPKDAETYQRIVSEEYERLVQLGRSELEAIERAWAKGEM